MCRSCLLINTFEIAFKETTSRSGSMCRRSVVHPQVIEVVVLVRRLQPWHDVGSHKSLVDLRTRRCALINRIIKINLFNYLISVINLDLLITFSQKTNGLFPQNPIAPNSMMSESCCRIGICTHSTNQPFRTYCSSYCFIVYDSMACPNNFLQIGRASCRERV